VAQARVRFYIRSNEPIGK